MNINRLSSGVSPNAVKVTGGSAPETSSPMRLASDSLSLPSSIDAKAAGLLREGQALDARGLTAPALDSFTEATEEAETLDILLAIRDALKQRPQSWENDKLIDRAVERAEDMVKDLPVTSLKGDAGARAYCAHAVKMDGLGLPGAAEAAYTKAVTMASTYVRAMAIVDASQSMGHQERVRANTVDHLADLAKTGPISKRQGDASVEDLLKEANKMHFANLSPLTEVFYKRALEAGTTPASFHLVQQYWSQLEDPYLLPDFNEQAKEKLHRLDNPIKWWNPLTW